MEAVTTFFSGFTMPSLFDLLKPDPVYSCIERKCNQVNISQGNCISFDDCFHSGCPVIAPTYNKSIFGCSDFESCSPSFTESTYVHNEYLIYNEFEKTMMVKANELSILAYEGEYFNGELYYPDIDYNSHGIELSDMVRFKNKADENRMLPTHSNGFTAILKFNTTTFAPRYMAVVAFTGTLNSQDWSDGLLNFDKNQLDMHNGYFNRLYHIQNYLIAKLRELQQKYRTFRTEFQTNFFACFSNFELSFMISKIFSSLDIRWVVPKHQWHRFY